MDWAGTQNNLGNALADLGARAGDTAALQDAVTAFRAALEVRTREASPMDWAMTQNNLGNALAATSAPARATPPRCRTPSPPTAPRWRSTRGRPARWTGP
jgi:hypothetical protein